MYTCRSILHRHHRWNRHHRITAGIVITSRQPSRHAARKCQCAASHLSWRPQPPASAAAGLRSPQRGRWTRHRRGSRVQASERHRCRRWTRHRRWLALDYYWAPAEQVGTGVGAGRTGVVEQAPTWALARGVGTGVGTNVGAFFSPVSPVSPASASGSVSESSSAFSSSRSSSESESSCPPRNRSPPRSPPWRPPRNPSYMRTLLHKRNPASCNAVTSLSKRLISVVT